MQWSWNRCAHTTWVALTNTWDLHACNAVESAVFTLLQESGATSAVPSSKAVSHRRDFSLQQQLLHASMHEITVELWCIHSQSQNRLQSEATVLTCKPAWKTIEPNIYNRCDLTDFPGATTCSLVLNMVVCACSQTVWASSIPGVEFSSSDLKTNNNSKPPFGQELDWQTAWQPEHGTD